jgi:hypothetical protein
MGFEQEPDVHTETVCNLALRFGHGNNIQAKFVLKGFSLPLNCAVEDRRETSCAQTSGRDVLKKSLGMDAALSDSYVLRCRSKAGYLSCQAVTESAIFLTMAFKLSLRHNMPPQLWAWIQRINTLPLSSGVSGNVGELVQQFAFLWPVFSSTRRPAAAAPLVIGRFSRRRRVVDVVFMNYLEKSAPRSGNRSAPKGCTGPRIHPCRQLRSSGKTKEEVFHGDRQIHRIRGAKPRSSRRV